jgi:hypothetical protein
MRRLNPEPAELQMRTLIKSQLVSARRASLPGVQVIARCLKEVCMSRIVVPFFFTLGLLSLISLSPPAQAELRCAAPLFATDFDGKARVGSKAALIDAVQRGEPIRIGWELDFDEDGAPNLAHWADAGLLSLSAGEVHAQISAVQRQRPQVDGSMDLHADYVEWRGMLGSDNRLQGRYSDGTPFPANLKVRSTWCSALPPPPRWEAVYRHGLEGEALSGSKEALFAAIRAGQAIQIGWGFRAEREGEPLQVEHLISPVFITITSGRHAVAQLPEHIAQRSYVDAEQAFFGNPSVMWRGLMSTTGSFDAVWVDRASGEVIRRYPQRAMLTWYAQNRAPLDTPTLAGPGGVTRDATRADESFPS